jgi:hypothetical protein
MKILINESDYRKILREFKSDFSNPHFTDRTFQRFFGQTYYDVIAVINGDFQNAKIIGEFEIPQIVKNRVQKILDHLHKPEYVGEHSQTFIIELYEFNLNQNNIIFKGNTPQERLDNIKLYRNQPDVKTYLQERPIEGHNETQQSPTRGFYLICYVTNDYLKTMLLERSKNPDYLVDKAKKRTGSQDVVFIKDPFTQLDAYMDIDTIRNQKPEEHPEPEPEDPPMSDHERRLQAYKDKMKNLPKKKK